MKKIIKDIRFLVAVFVLFFVAFGGLAVNAFVSGGGIGDGDGGSFTPIGHSRSPAEAVASAFYFKAPVLQLDVNSAPNTSFLVITDQYEIIGAKVYGTSVSVETNPEFKISVIHSGQAEVHLSARKSCGDIKTITCTVVVADEPVSVDDVGDTEVVDETPPVIAELSYKFETPTSISFGLVVNQKDVPGFWLAAEIIEGDVKVGIFGNAANITHRSANPNFKIRFTATVDGEIVATKYVQNCL